MDDSDLANMDQKDLEAIHLKSLKIMEAREQEIINAIHTFDINALKDALATNKDKILSPTVWNEIHISMHCLNAENIDMFLFIKNLPQFAAQNSKTSSHTTIIEQAICKSFFDEELFDFFYNHQEFSPMLKKMAETYALVDTVPKEVIHKLFQLKIFKPTKKILATVLEYECFNYLEYFLDNELYKLSKNDYKKIYKNIWKECNSSTLDKLKQKYHEHRELPLSELIGGFFIFLGLYEEYDSNTIDKKYRQFVNLDKDIFSRTLLTHKMSKIDVIGCIKAFDDIAKFNEDNFHCLIELIVNNFPEYCQILKNTKGSIKSQKLKPLYEQAMDYVDLNLDLDKHGKQKKKLKV
jgi:hypothetical protein